MKVYGCLKGCALVVVSGLVLAVGGCSRPIVDMHWCDGSLVKGPVPVLFSGGAPGEKHHEYSPVDVERMKGIFGSLENARNYCSGPVGGL